MNKTLLLTAASVLALCTSGALVAGPVRSLPAGKAASFKMAKAAQVLWNQNSNDAGDAINSQNYTSDFGPTYNDQGADDFVVPKGQKWTVTEIDVSGAYIDGAGPAMSENVIFYKNKHGMPGTPVRNGTFKNLKGVDNDGNFVITLPGKGLELNAGKYWTSVIANMELAQLGQWGWEVNAKRHGKQAMWQNPDGGFAICPTWGTIENCQNSPGPDFMFALGGTSRDR
jgi:hypothetical protein